MMKNLLRHKLIGLALLGVSVLVTIFALELVVRLVAPQQLILLRSDIWVPDPDLGWRHGAKLNTRVNTGERSVSFVTDAAGHRVAQSQPADSGKADKRLLFLGDSFLAALQVEYEASFAGLIERELIKQTGLNIDVVNAGVGAWGPIQYLRRAEQELAAKPYHGVVVFIFLQNDIDRRQEEIVERPPTVRHALRLPTELALAEWTDALAYPINDWLEVRSHLYTLLKNRAKYVLIKLGLSAHYFPDVVLTENAEDPAWSETAEVCADIAKLTAALDLPLLFVLLPGDFQIDTKAMRSYSESFDVELSRIDLEQPNTLLAKELRARGLAYIDTTPALRKAFERGRKLYGDVDPHFTPAGHQVTTEVVVPVLRDWF